jgi:hypothetical protein
MVVYRRERPQCRRALISLMKEYGCGLDGLLHHPTMFMSDGLRIQARKMLEESNFKTAKEVSRDRKKNDFRRLAGLIR